MSSIPHFTADFLRRPGEGIGSPEVGVRAGGEPPDVAL